MLARFLLVVAVSTPGLQRACDHDIPSPETPGAGEVATTEDGASFEIQTLVTGLEVPWALAFAPDGRLFLTERPGRVRIVENDRLLPEPALTLPDVYTAGEAGLLGLALDPDFASNHFVYLQYTAVRPGRDPETKIVRYLEARNTLLDGVTLIDGLPAHRVHDGGRLRFGPDEALYATLGDVADRTTPQDLGTLAGKILRITREGRTPRDNPFASQVFSYGHRNPQGIDWHPSTGEMWATEHGPVGNDEVNRIRGGRNYGWPDVEGMATAVGATSPVLLFTPAVAPSGASFYTGDAFPAFRHDLFFATLRGEHLHRVVLSPADPTLVVTQERLLDGRFGRLRDVVTGPDGAIYLCTNNRDGRGTPGADDDRLIRLVPVAGAAGG